MERPDRMSVKPSPDAAASWELEAGLITDQMKVFVHITQKAFQAFGSVKVAPHRVAARSHKSKSNMRLPVSRRQ
jgi:hypothetical protein